MTDIGGQSERRDREPAADIAPLAANAAPEHVSQYQQDQQRRGKKNKFSHRSQTIIASAVVSKVATTGTITVTTPTSL